MHTWAVQGQLSHHCLHTHLSMPSASLCILSSREAANIIFAMDCCVRIPTITHLSIFFRHYGIVPSDTALRAISA